MNNYDMLIFTLDKGLYVDNISDMIKICQDLSTQNTQYAWVFFIFNTLFYDLIHDMEDRPVKKAEINYLENNISPHIKEIIDDLKEHNSISQIINKVNLLVLNFPKVMSDLKNI